MTVMMLPIAMMTGYIGEWLVTYPNMSMIGYITPTTGTVGYIVNNSRSPIRRIVNNNPLTIIF